MSYCRFSSDNFGSDVYCYEAVYGGIQIHVAGNRVVGDVPKLPPMAPEFVDEFVEAYAAQMAFMKTAKREPIDLPYAGESFSEETPRAAADRLLALRALGYRVPQYAIENLLSEAAVTGEVGQLLNQLDDAALEPQE